MRTEFWLKIWKGRDHSVDVDVNGRIVLKWILRKYGGRLRSAFIWLRTGTIVNAVINTYVP
jgi:hypothetical protein